MNGWIETREQIESRWSVRKFEADKVRTCLEQITEAQADKLHELVEMCNTDPAHIAHNWMLVAEGEQADAQDRQDQITELRNQ
jgi:hypothetical protein